MHLKWSTSGAMLWLSPSASETADGADAPDAAEPASTEQRRGTIDVGPRGRLLGVEFEARRESLRPWAADLPPHFFDIPVDGHVYIALEGGSSDLARSAPFTAQVDLDADGNVLRVGIPRRGPSWELSWPSGNE